MTDHRLLLYLDRFPRVHTLLGLRVKLGETGLAALDELIARHLVGRFPGGVAILPDGQAVAARLRGP